MEQMKLQIQANCYYPLPGQRILWMKHLNFNRKEGFRSRCLIVSNARQNTFASNLNVLCRHGSKCKNKNKGINVTISEKSLDRTLKLLEAYEDEYDGAIIDPESLPTSANAFATVLQSSISYWKLKGKKGIWLKILEKQADLVPIAIREGFSYHHAERGYVMLTYWIPDGPCMLPTTGTHQIGIGGFVINDSREVLVVKEKSCPLRCSGTWKLPTGFINKSEEICMGAIREVKEETGIDTLFTEVLAFRHAHNVTFEKSDLFFVCMLKPLSFDITIDESEIEAAKWMALDEFIDQPFVRGDDFSKSMIEVCISRYEDRYRGFIARPLMSMFDDRLSYFYFGELQKSTETLLLPE